MNQPAFPLHNHGTQTLGMHFTGMTLRDYFAAKAMQSMNSRDDYQDAPADVIALVAYALADAMMKERGAMTQEETTELLQRIFAVNEQIVRQNQKQARKDNAGGKLGAHSYWGKWMSQIRVHGELKYLGNFSTKEDMMFTYRPKDKCMKGVRCD